MLVSSSLRTCTNLVGEYSTHPLDHVYERRHGLLCPAEVQEVAQQHKAGFTMLC